MISWCKGINTTPHSPSLPIPVMGIGRCRLMQLLMSIWRLAISALC
nr:MAG TPA: hypothetical protein [Caudoviricetes sp.]